MANGSRGAVPPSRRPAFRRILLVGFMGSGKSTVGTLLASRLGWSFRDFDAEVERRAGATVEEIFRREGEAGFRRLEAEVARGLLEAEHVVLASGGGWPAAPGRMDALENDTLSVWLEVGAETAVQRVLHGEPARPLLEVPDPVARARTLIRERSPHYERALLHLDAENASPEELADRILDRLEAAAHGTSGS